SRLSSVRPTRTANPPTTSNATPRRLWSAGRRRVIVSVLPPARRPSTPMILRVRRGDDGPCADDGVVLVQDRGLAPGHGVGGLVQLEAKAPPGRAHGGRGRRRPVAELRLDAVGRAVQPPLRLDHAARERGTRPYHDGVRPGIGLQHIERRCGGEAEPPALPGREAPVPTVTAEPAAFPVDDRTLSGGQPLALEESAVVVPGEEAGLLAFGPGRDDQPGRCRLGSRLRLPLVAEREPD